MNVELLELELEQERGNEPKIYFLDKLEEEPRIKLHILAKYVRRHHKRDQIIGDSKSSVMTRRKIKGDTCLLCEFNPKSIKYYLDNEYWIHVMNEEID